MRKLFGFWIAVLVTCTMTLGLTKEALADKRVALVVGISQYRNTTLNLPNPKNDAEDVAAVLRTLGFEVIYKTDVSKRELELSMAQFARAATNADAALFFYAGHALQYQGQNFLMPADATLEDEISLRYQMMGIEDVRAALDRSSGVKIMILDACRNNPIVDQLRRRMSGSARALELTRGLARLDKTQGMVIAYATSADDVAADGNGRNSPYTAALLKRLQEPGLEVEMMFRRIAADVNAETNGRQRPETSVSLLSEYYINQLDRMAWEKVKDSSDPATLNDFVRRFPSSTLVSLAQNRVQFLGAQNRERMEREAAERLAQQRQDEDRARLATAERARVEREAAQRQTQQRQDDEQRARIAAAERARAEREAEQRRLDDEKRNRLAGVERVQQEKAAEAERQRRQQEVAVKVAPTPAPARPALAQEQACPRDADILARLRASPSRDEVVRFERELGCERLRPQVMRLRESLGIDDRFDDRRTVVAEAPLPVPRSRIAVMDPPGTEDAANQQTRPTERPTTDTNQQRQSPQKAPQMAAVRVSQEQACKLDNEKLVRLRASPKFDDVVRFETELLCERLRPQVKRLRESVAN